MSAIWPIDQAVDAAIQGDATLAAKLQGEKVYSLVAPPTDDALPYIVLGQSTETIGRMFGGKNYDTILTIDAWSGDLSKAELAESIVPDLERLLDGTMLTLNGLAFCSGVFSVVAIVLDINGKYSHASCRYEVLSFA